MKTEKENVQEKTTLLKEKKLEEKFLNLEKGKLPQTRDIHHHSKRTIEVLRKIAKSYEHQKWTEDQKEKHKKLIKNLWKEKNLNLINNTPFEELPGRLKIRVLFAERGNKCEECGYDYVDSRGKGPYEIHHIDGNKNNWSKENLKIICLNCHWKTRNWRFRGKHHTNETKEKIRRTLTSKGDKK